MAERKGRILVVDDEQRNLELMEAFLVPLGYAVDLAPDGERALGLAKEAPPDLVLLDIMMPKMDGFEVARRLKGDPETRHIPIVMVTALTEVEYRVRALEAGADDFLSKPVEKTELKARVGSLLKVKAYTDHMRDYQKELEKQVARRTAQLQEAFDKIKLSSLETIHRLARAAEYKDEDTGAHIQRMSNYTACIARKMGLDAKRVETLLYAAPMHDIGKIGIPDRILLKPEKLDEAEWLIMKQHTTIGGRILEGSDISFIKLAETVALTHHEKWDGSGYPKGLAKNDIPVEGRIAALADVFDAAISKRPYKEAFSIEKAFQIIREGRGSHFDPAVVDAFFAVQDEIVAVSKKYQDERESLFLKIQEEAAAPGPRPEGLEKPVPLPERLGDSLEEMKRQHRQIAATIDELDAAIRGDLSLVPEIFAELNRQTAAHLRDEETILRQTGYPEFEKHKDLHDWIRRETAVLTTKYRRAPGDLSPSVVDFLRDCWDKHIRWAGKAYAPHIARAAGRTEE